MMSGSITVIYSVTDLAQAKTLFGTLLGVAPYADESYDVGFRVGGEEVGLDPQRHSQGMTGPVAYWHVDDITGTVKVLLAAGAEEHQQVRDVSGGKLIASVTDADGNVIGLVQPA